MPDAEARLEPTHAIAVVEVLVEDSAFDTPLYGHETGVTYCTDSSPELGATQEDK